jgi:hypothetical protein
MVAEELDVRGADDDPQGLEARVTAQPLDLSEVLTTPAVHVDDGELETAFGQDVREVARRRHGRKLGAHPLLGEEGHHQLGELRIFVDDGNPRQAGPHDMTLGGAAPPSHAQLDLRSRESVSRLGQRRVSGGASSVGPVAWTT